MGEIADDVKLTTPFHLGLRSGMRGAYFHSAAFVLNEWSVKQEELLSNFMVMCVLHAYFRMKYLHSLKS
jgi:hypothetical protein